MPISPRSALLVIDVQNDFIPGGQLAVPEGDVIVPLINRLAGQFTQVVIAQDWHRPDMLRLRPAILAASRMT